MAKFRKDFSKRATSEKFKNKENPKTMKGKILNIARKIGIALGITGTVATTAVYADMKYNDAEISKGIIKMFSGETTTDKNIVPQGTFEQRQVDLMTQTTKKPTDPKPEPAKGGGEPDDDENTGNNDFSPEKPEQKDSIKTKNREPEGELRAKAETNEEEINWDEADWEGSDEELEKAKNDLKETKERVEKKKENLTATKKEEKKIDEKTTETQKELAEVNAKIAELEGKKGE